ncbi:hypothetical protein RDI58_021940 [Solanum bulbocastanum]
MKLWKY